MTLNTLMFLRPSIVAAVVLLAVIGCQSVAPDLASTDSANAIAERLSLRKSPNDAVSYTHLTLPTKA